MAQDAPPESSLGRLSFFETKVEQLSHPGPSDKAQDPNAIWPALQFLATQQAFVGQTDAAIASFDRGLRPFRSGQTRMTPDEVARINAALAEDAIDAIVAEARQRQVVILNEAHHVPMGRAFAARLATELRKIGYEYLACETFDVKEGRVPLGPHGEAVTGTGFYTQEPVFAAFVNSAVADGWKLVPYEAAGVAQIDQRERGQVKNLVDRIFSHDKKAKVFIYVGFDHVNKWIEGSGSKRMAAYLQEATGLNMLHVQQTSFYAHPDKADEPEHYGYLVDKFRSRQPFVLRGPDGSFTVLLGKQGIVDMQVVFPRYGQIDGRPEWLSSLLGREPRPIPARLLPIHGRRLIKAYPKGAAADAVATDIVIVQAGQPAPSLMLPKGDYVYQTETE